MDARPAPRPAPPQDARARSVIALGECMVELSPAGEGLYRRGFAGDTFNTAWYLRRCLPRAWRVAYGTGVGQDAVSEEMAGFIAASGLETDAIRRVPGRSVGLYMIALEEGERRFSYWRTGSAATRLAEDRGWLDAVLAGRRAIHVSGITLAIVGEPGRARLTDALGAAREGGSTVVLDPNMRPALWSSARAMGAAIEAGAAVADIVLPSLDEERALVGGIEADAVIARYRALGATTVAVKDGAGAIRHWDAAEGEGVVRPPEVARVIDTTAAGDSFDAAFLGARLTGADMGRAVAAGAALAARVVQAPGALVPQAFESPAA